MQDLMSTRINERVSGSRFCYTIETSNQRRFCLVMELEKLLVHRGNWLKKDSYTITK